MLREKRLKILFLPEWYPSEKNPVAGIFVKEHAKAVSLYNEVIVLYSEGCEKNLKGIWEITSDKKENGIRTIRIRHRRSPIPKTTYFIYLWSVFRAFRKLLYEGWEPDIIHSHVYSAGVPGVILGRIYKIPVIITEHYTNFATYSLTFLERIKAKFAMNRAKIILPVSNDLRQAIENYYGIKNKFEVVPNVVNTEIFYPSNLRSKNKNNDKKRMLSVCILTPRKGIHYLLKSLSQLKQKRQDFVLDIVGDGPNRKEYENLTKNLGLDGIVKFYGRQPEVASFMRKCDFFVLPSLYENFGVVYMEAMACGKPVIGTSAGGSREIITKEVGKLVPPKNVDVLAEAIDYMLDHYQDYSPEKISQYAKENFSYEVVGAKIDKIYREILYKTT